jgi:hypothetical protein
MTDAPIPIRRRADALSAERRATDAAHMLAAIALTAGGRIRADAAPTLAYLANREHLERTMTPFVGAVHARTPQGPVDATALALVSGEIRSDVFDALLRREGDMLVATDAARVDELDSLSLSTSYSAGATGASFGAMDLAGIMATLAEDPDAVDCRAGEGRPIGVAEILVAQGIDPCVAADVERHEDGHRGIERMFDEMRVYEERAR